MQGGFEYASQPRSVAVKRSKYREPTAPYVVTVSQASNNDKGQNLMYDRRIVRGSTYAKPVVLEDTAATSPARPSRLPKKVQEVDSLASSTRPLTPPPMDGRQHMDIQTENYLEELTDKVPEADVETQTEAFMDQLPVPLFVPQKRGVDASTQIDHGDLFDFDLEVAPILEVLVGKTLEVSVMEVLEEEEVKELRTRQDIFEQARNAELAEVQRLEAEAKRKQEEKTRRLEEEKARVVAQAELQEKLAARSFAKHYLADLHTAVFSTLVTTGHFQDPMEKEVTEAFMPYLIQRACVNVEQIAFSRALAEVLVDEAIHKTSSSFDPVRVVNSNGFPYHALHVSTFKKPPACDHISSMFKANDQGEDDSVIDSIPETRDDRQDKLRKAFAEGLGTMILVLIGDGVVAQTVISQQMELRNAKLTSNPMDVTAFAGDWMSISLGFGIALMLGIYVSGGVSGGHLNPAVSITMAVFKKLEWSYLPYYIGGQTAGAFLGAVFVYLGYRPAFVDLNIWDQTTAGIFATYPKSHMTLVEGFIDEIVGSFLLLLGIFAITDKRNNPADPGSRPAIIGMLLAGIAMSFGYNTGFALNPARDFGPRLFTLMAGWGGNVFVYGNGYFWVPIFAPVFGGLAGAFVYTYCIERFHPQYVPGNRPSSSTIDEDMA
ncbi:hypothetical protein DYB30_002097 [Aphanomyces astaci]|uniref:Uncharacterized protein n=1 Tax=Aphanomyces astaci TaxID=112090 RepID=A0A397DIK7_APHAT|nr:hypothetical protein DYB30_002097 [Aphanomyces astaci]